MLEDYNEHGELNEFDGEYWDDEILGDPELDDYDDNEFNEYFDDDDIADADLVHLAGGFYWSHSRGEIGCAMVSEQTAEVLNAVMSESSKNEVELALRERFADQLAQAGIVPAPLAGKPNKGLLSKLMGLIS